MLFLKSCVPGRQGSVGSAPRKESQQLLGGVHATLRTARSTPFTFRPHKRFVDRGSGAESAFCPSVFSVSGQKLLGRLDTVSKANYQVARHINDLLVVNLPFAVGSGHWLLASPSCCRKETLQGIYTCIHPPAPLRSACFFLPTIRRGKTCSSVCVMYLVL